MFKRTNLNSLSEGYTSYKVKKKLNTQPCSKGIVSTCIFGATDKTEFKEKYIQPLIKNCHIIQDVLPGWCMRVYVPPDLPSEIIDSITSCGGCGCEVYVMENIPTGYIGTLWRFLPASENKPFISYDADMLLNEDNYYMANLSKNVSKWLESDKIFFQRTLGHINYIIPISAGMWGAKPTREGFAPIPDIERRLEKYNSDWFGCDEAFLTKEVYPLFKPKGVFKVRNTIEIIIGIFVFILFVLLILKLCLIFFNRIKTKTNSRTLNNKI